MRLKLSKLQESDNEAQKIRAKRLKNGYKEVDRVLHHQRLLFILEAIQTELISQYHNNLLARYFGIKKTNNLIGQKYHWLSLQKDIKIYVKGYDICLGSKTIKYKPYGNLQFLFVPTHQ